MAGTAGDNWIRVIRPHMRADEWMTPREIAVRAQVSNMRVGLILEFAHRNRFVEFGMKGGRSVYRLRR